MIAVNVAQLLRAQVGTFRSYEFGEQEPDLAAELGLRGPIEGRVKLTRTPRGILAEVAYRVTVEQECGRCLEPVRTDLESEFGEEYVALTNVTTGQPLAGARAEADEQVIDQNHVLDLTDAIRQDIVVQQPIQPLCRENCAGLCVTCGADLNQAPCGHETQAAGEQPLGRLGELLKQQLPPGAQVRN